MILTESRDTRLFEAGRFRFHLDVILLDPQQACKGGMVIARSVRQDESEVIAHQIFLAAFDMYAK